MNANKYLKKTKIVATLGPATDSKEILLDMMTKGVDVFRINFSHAEYDEVKKKIETIHQLNDEHGFNTAVLADLQGPKLRIGKMEHEDFVINPGDILTFTNEKVIGNAEKVYMTYPKFAQDVQIGENILIDDGKLIFTVIETNGVDTVKAKTIQGGPLRSKKGVNLPNTKISLPALTEKDKEDALFAIENRVDWFALSFVRSAQDVEDLKAFIRENSNLKIPIISKIEKPEALQNIDDILKVSDGLMVARGDLGVEVPFEEVPREQKRLIDKSKLARKPVIVATQMMESMISSLTPTRAEVSDVANAVFDGADAVMLSGETSVGKYPVQVIEKMTKILQTVEDDEHINIPEHQPKIQNERFVTDIVCYNAAKMVEQTNAKVIATLTYSGYTAFQISSHRPLSYILVFNPSKRINRMLNLLWGVKAINYDPRDTSTDQTVIEVNTIAIERGFVKYGEYIINLNAMPAFEKGITNTVRLTTA
ncbi:MULTISPECIES: pyruvate kinase [Weeksella]|uniref:Pyruvate kinase n=1 Tax=Weeksella virosa (strain ATCC 43766 / DSM 16922 / JCM 21250 / CCUG 30538 / CDC 9751 / IAM 14551 / NBRC 16016 / NCTC 11634 / CL345/78) TaxID=865938 RepID=F0P287_WEEVC|nr:MULTISPECIES: pyruvate kinase [Weeksella]ADX67777.1 pyruvate kinase [Weeksella virosa DSM 16922]MDK7374067.1 pyruvate kinase [Weeksella virosa]MDK7674322.1 pyruvate kinase [Weeksella virosa]OFM82752.1 pyruvate kinase [Weeksella sp. HMSC059D05]SUP54076.1 Pyruvate kinase [Weeksella virosa]